MPLFAVAEEFTHHVGEMTCPACSENYPESCPCGGLIHAAAESTDLDDNPVLTTRCDRCGRSEDNLDEV